MTQRLAVRFAMAALVGLSLTACTGTEQPPSAPSGIDSVPAGAEESEATSGQDRERGLGEPPTRTDLVGTWRPLTLLGKDVRQVRRVNGDRLTVTFTQRSNGLGWSAYDGCNWTSGRLRLEQSGSVSTSEDATTLRGCIGHDDTYGTNVEAIADATLARIGASVLRFFDSTGLVLGEYRRTGPGL